MEVWKLRKAVFEACGSSRASMDAIAKGRLINVAMSAAGGERVEGEDGGDGGGRL